MASQQTVLDFTGRAFWDPKPTRTDLRARQLATALGYPTSWRVVRTIEETPGEEEDGRKCIVDRIYSGPPGVSDMWYHHEAAMAAAEKWDDTTSTQHDSKGGHLLPRQPLYAKKDKVQVLYEGKWWDATVQRRVEKPDGYKYTVHYQIDNAKQAGVDESFIRLRPAAQDPKKIAVTLGFGEDSGWEATSTGHNRWRIVAPDGTVFTSKNKALEAYRQMAANDDDRGDPPWRTSGHEYLGRRVLWKIEHKASARRTVKIEQVGTVTGWISETDVDSAGLPGFVSDRTGKPACLFHVDFDDDPNHPYASHLVAAQDLEEYELLECIMEEEETTASPKKKAKKN